MLYGTQNEYLFIFLGVTADVDYSTNLSANQASYTFIISQLGQLHQSTKERKLESITRLS